MFLLPQVSSHTVSLVRELIHLAFTPTFKNLSTGFNMLLKKVNVYIFVHIVNFHNKIRKYLIQFFYLFKSSSLFRIPKFRGFLFKTAALISRK